MSIISAQVKPSTITGLAFLRIMRRYNGPATGASTSNEPAKAAATIFQRLRAMPILMMTEPIPGWSSTMLAYVAKTRRTCQNNMGSSNGAIGINHSKFQWLVCC